MNKSNKKHLDYEQLITMYSLISRGCGYKEVCAKLNCSRQTLYRIITQHCTIKNLFIAHLERYLKAKKKFERVIDVAITTSNLSFFNAQKNFTDSLHLLFQLTKFAPFWDKYGLINRQNWQKCYNFI